MKKTLFMLAIVAGAASCVVAGGKTPAANTVPRARDGKPNLSGIWQVLNSAEFDLQDHAAQKGIPAGQGVVEGGEIPYQPWALAKKKENFAKRLTADPEIKCYLPGVPRATYMPFPFQIIQGAKSIMIAYEYADAVRNIPLNNPGESPA